MNRIGSAILALSACGGLIDASPGHDDASRPGDAGLDALEHGDRVASPIDSGHVEPCPDAGAVGTFERTFSGESDSIALDSAGSIYVTGSFQNTIDYGDGPHTSSGKGDIFLVKLDGSGQVLWTKTFGTPMPDEGMRVAVDAQDNVVMAGASPGAIDLGGGPLPPSADGPYYAGDSFLARFTPSGAHIESKRFACVSFRSMAVAGLETYAFGIGDLVDPPDAAPLGAVTLAHVGAGFDPVWLTKVNSKYWTYPSAVLPDGFGGAIFGGPFTGEIHIGSSITSSSDALYIARVNATGIASWTTTFGCGLGAAELGALAYAHDGILATGYISGSCDIGNGPGGGGFFVSKRGMMGAAVWAARFGPGPGSPRAVAEGCNGQVIVTGYFLETVDFGDQKLTSKGSSDIVVLKLDRDGKTISSQQFGTAGMDSGIDLVIDKHGAILTTGYETGSWYVRKLSP